MAVYGLVAGHALIPGRVGRILYGQDLHAVQVLPQSSVNTHVRGDGAGVIATSGQVIHLREVDIHIRVAIVRHEWIYSDRNGITFNHLVCRAGRIRRRGVHHVDGLLTGCAVAAFIDQVKCPTISFMCTQARVDGIGPIDCRHAAAQVIAFGQAGRRRRGILVALDLDGWWAEGHHGSDIVDHGDGLAAGHRVVTFVRSCPGANDLEVPVTSIQGNVIHFLNID